MYALVPWSNGASQFPARSPRSFAPHIRFLFVGPRFRYPLLSAPASRRVTLCFARSPIDLVLQRTFTSKTCPCRAHRGWDGQSQSAPAGAASLSAENEAQAVAARRRTNEAQSPNRTLRSLTDALTLHRHGSRESAQPSKTSAQNTAVPAPIVGERAAVEDLSAEHSCAGAIDHSLF